MHLPCIGCVGTNPSQGSSVFFFEKSLAALGLYAFALHWMCGFESLPRQPSFFSSKITGCFGCMHLPCIILHVELCPLCLSVCRRFESLPRQPSFFSSKITGCFGCMHLPCIILHVELCPLCLSVCRRF